jgi:hypothetical protein
MSDNTLLKDYTEQLSRIATSLAVAKNGVVHGDVAAGQSCCLVEMFTSGNLDKRADKLNDQLDMFAETMEELPGLISRYIREIPLAAYDTGTSDTDRFVRWLPTVIKLTPEQRDLILVIKSRFTVEEAGRRNRLGHIRFQELASLNDRLVSELESIEGLRIHLNPMKTRAVFETGLLIGEEESPADGVEVLFFAFQIEVRTVILEREGRAVVQTLSEIGPCRLASLKKQLDLTTSFDDESLMEILNDCSEVGLIAFS